MTRPEFEDVSMALAGESQNTDVSSRLSAECNHRQFERTQKLSAETPLEVLESQKAQALVAWASEDGSNGLARFDAYPKFDIGMAGWGHVLDKRDLKLGLASTDPRSTDHKMLQMIWDNYDTLKKEAANVFGIHFDGICANDLRVFRDYKAKVAASAMSQLDSAPQSVQAVESVQPVQPVQSLRDARDVRPVQPARQTSASPDVFDNLPPMVYHSDRFQAPSQEDLSAPRQTENTRFAQPQEARQVDPQEVQVPQQQEVFKNPTFEHTEHLTAQALVTWASKDGDNGLARFDAFPKFDPGMAGWGHVLDRRDIKLGLESTDPRSKDHQMLQMISDNYDVMKQEAANFLGIHFDGICQNDLRSFRDYKARIDVPHPDFSAPQAVAQRPDVRPAPEASVQMIPEQAPIERPVPVQPRIAQRETAPAPEVQRIQEAPRYYPDEQPRYTQPPQTLRYNERQSVPRYESPQRQEYRPVPQLTFEQQEALEAQRLITWASKDGQNGLARFDAHPKFDIGMAGWGHVLDKRDLKLGLASTDPRSEDHRMLQMILDNYDSLKKQAANFLGIHFDGICLNDLRVHKKYMDKVARNS